MHVSVRKWGNSPSVRLPAAVMAAAGLRIDQRVDVRAEEGRIVIEPVADDFDLTAALAAITAENLHDEAEYGGPAGAEAW